VTERLKKALIVLVLQLAIAAIIGFIAPAFFTPWAREYNYFLNYAWILGHFSPLCVAFLLLAILPIAAIVLISLVNEDLEDAELFTVTGAITVLLWPLVEDLVAHLRYGSLALDDWTHWGLPSFLAVAPDFWIPTWYLLIIGICSLIFLVYRLYKKRE